MSPPETTRRCVTVQDQDEIQAILAEAETTTDTADKLANGDYPEEADHTRGLAGLIKQRWERAGRPAGARRGARRGGGAVASRPREPVPHLAERPAAVADA